MVDERPQRIGRLAGALWLTGAVSALPIALALGTSPSRALIGVMPAALVGLVCLVVPWGSLRPGWLHAPALAGSVAVAVAVATAGAEGAAFAWLGLLVGGFCAIAFDTRARVAGELVFASFALLAGAAVGGSLATVFPAVPALIAVAAVIAVQRERLETHSQRDPLTGVGNYRVLSERLRYEMIRHERHRRSFAVMLLDLDRFKLINDRYGHLEGDRVLRSVARAINKVVRDQDTVARQGGDEFSVLLPETGDHGAAIVAEKINAALVDLVVGGVPIRASIGWAVFPHEGRTAESLLAVADERSREAKQTRHQRQPDVAARDLRTGERVAA